jgi:hypothetical protein
MKKLIISTALILWFVGASAQYKLIKDDLEHFFKTKTLVVLEDNPILSYNFTIKEVVKKEWTITPYEFISYQEFEQKRNDPKYSFLLLTSVTFDKDKTKARYRFIQALLGGDYKLVPEMPEISSVPLAYLNVDEDNYIYKLGTVVRFMQNQINHLHEHPEEISSNLFKHYNENMGDIKNKTLYLVADELAKNVNSAARIKKIYPYKFKIVTRAEVEDAIERKDTSVVFLHKVGPEGTKSIARCYKIIIGAADSKFYYFDYHMIDKDDAPDSFLEKDFKKLAKK